MTGVARFMIVDLNLTYLTSKSFKYEEQLSLSDKMDYVLTQDSMTVAHTTDGSGNIVDHIWV